MNDNYNEHLRSMRFLFGGNSIFGDASTELEINYLFQTYLLEGNYDSGHEKVKFLEKYNSWQSS